MKTDTKTDYNQKVDNRTWRGTISLLVVLSVVHLSIFPFMSVFFFALYTENLYILAIQSLILTYQFSPYCQRQEWFLKAMNIPVLYEYFREWTCTFEEPLKKNKCMIAAAPHGILTFAFIMNSGKYYQKTHILGSRMILMLPANGLFLRWCGCQPVDGRNMKKMMKKGENLAIVPGGFEEATLTSKTECRMFIKKRKGFIKYALQQGYEIYPMYVFGENNLYNVFEPYVDFRLKLNKYKLPGVLFFSNMGIFPSNNVRLHTVIGKSMQVPHIANPTKEDVGKYHQQYIEAMKDLFYKNRAKYGETSDLYIY